MSGAPFLRPGGGPHGIRKGAAGPEIAMNPRNLVTTPPATALPHYALHNENPVRSAPAVTYHPQVDVSTQVDLHGAAIHVDWDRRVTPLYSREDIKEQYCITSRQLDAVEKSGGGIFSCLSTRIPSPCGTTKTSILSACVRAASSEENLCDAPYPRKSLQIMYHQPYPTYSRGQSRYDVEDEDWVESSYFRRRPRSFCSAPDPKRYMWVPEDEEESTRLEGPRSVLPPAPPPPQSSQPIRTKHVSFARSHTLTSFDVPQNRSPSRSHNQERLIDSQPTMQGSISSTLSLPHPYTNAEPRVLVLEKPLKRGVMKAQATQTDVPQVLRNRMAPITLSPRTIHRVKMVSQGAQTNGLLNGRKLTKSYSEAGQLGTPLGVSASTESVSINGNEDAGHEPLQRTQSEEPPRSPFLVNTPPLSLSTTVTQQTTVEQLNGVIDRSTLEANRKEIELDDKEILIDFKPAPVSPDARAMLNQTARPCRRIVPLQKTFSDGEIQVERRELIGENGEPSYPHTCKRNHQDPWDKAVRAPVLFSSTPENLSLFRITPPNDDHHEEEFHENLIRRGLFRKRSVSLEDGVQGLSTSESLLPRSLPTSPTTPISVSEVKKVVHSDRSESTNRHLLHAGQSTGVAASPFASSDSLANDLTRDHSDGIWNESQATVLQADSLVLLTPSSRRKHLLLLQHQQRSSMDTEALDGEDELEICPSSPKIQLEAATPIALVPSIEPPIQANNERSRSGLRRRSPGSPLAQHHSQSSSELGLSLARTDSGRTNTDVSETSTTEDYVTANTSTGTGTTTGNSATTSSRSKHPHLHSGTAPSAPASATATAAEGSSFESASSVYSLARSEAVIEEPCSPPAIIEETEVSPGLEPLTSPARSTSSSSSGSYDLEDAMPNAIEEPYPTTPFNEGEQNHDEGRHSSSGGYAESPPDPHVWTEEERRKRKKTFTLDFPAGTEDSERSTEVLLDNRDVSPTPSHRHRPRGKPLTTRSPHRNNKKRDSVQQQSIRSPQKDQWRDQAEDGTHVATSDDSSCSHHYHLLHHHHHHFHREGGESGRHRRTRESPRRKSGSYVSARKRSNEDKNAALTGSLPRRRSRPVEDVYASRLSPGERYQRSSGHNGHTSVIVKSPSPESRLKALSAESLRSVSPGSDSVFYSEGTDQSCVTTRLEPLDGPHCHHCGREVSEEIVQPPAGFADSPEGHRAATKYVSHRLYKKFDKRYRSEDRGERRHHRSSGSRSDVRAKSEERGGGRSSGRGSAEDGSRRRLQARSTDASMEILTGQEDEDSYVEPYTCGEWIYIGDLEESHVWKRPDSRDGDEEIPVENVAKERRNSQESTESERCFRKKYQAATHRMVHRKSSGEMYKRIQTKSFESDKRVIVKREVGSEFGFRIHGSKPVVVSAIEPDTPAESSGLEVGDIIMSVNGRSVMDATHSEVVRLAHSGTDVLELEVARTCNVLAPQVARGGPKEGAIGAPLYSGYLWRKAASSSSNKWVRRWFALRRDNCLYYYKTDADSQPVGAVMLLKYDVKPTPDVRPHSFAISKAGAPTLHLAADTEDAALRWSTVIREAVEKNDQSDTWLDASLRMQQMPPCAIQRPDCFGYLNKQLDQDRKSSSRWSKRYCVLKDAALYFYDDANAERAFGTTFLHGYRVHASASNTGGRKHAFELQAPDSTQKGYTFATESEMDKKRWLAALEYSIDRWIKIG